jgi:hypothetical protein
MAKRIEIVRINGNCDEGVGSVYGRELYDVRRSSEPTKKYKGSVDWSTTSIYCCE